jgi:hypothetical protein
MDLAQLDRQPLSKCSTGMSSSACRSIFPGCSFYSPQASLRASIATMKVKTKKKILIAASLVVYLLAIAVAAMIPPAKRISWPLYIFPILPIAALVFARCRRQ